METPSIADLRRLYYGGGSAEEYEFLKQAAELGVTAQDVLTLVESANDVVILTEQGAAPAAQANAVKLYTVDVAGKTALMARFPTGAAIQIEKEV